MSILERCPSYRESNKGSKEKQGTTLGVRFTEVSVKRESTVYLTLCTCMCCTVYVYGINITLANDLQLSYNLQISQFKSILENFGPILKSWKCLSWISNSHFLVILHLRGSKYILILFLKSQS